MADEPEVEERHAAAPDPVPGYELVDGDDGRPASVKLGTHHEPFLLREEVSAGAMMKNLTAAQKTQDAFLSLRAFVHPSEHARLQAAIDDEDNPITLRGTSYIVYELTAREILRPKPKP